jgi:hypothetical protein
MSEEDFEYILSAIEFVAIYGQRFFPLYSFNLRNGSWRMKTEKFEALNNEENCKIPNHLVGRNLEEVNIDGAKYIASRLPKFPPEGILQEGMDPKILYFRV